MFARDARSLHNCASLCTQHPNCLTFTFNLGSQRASCRGHSSIMISSSLVTAQPGSVTYEVASPPTSCRTPFDQETLSGNWTVIQRRCDGSLDFYRDWTQYQDGFGNPDGEFWLGLEKLRTLTSLRPYQLRFDLERWSGTTGFAVYSNFYVGPATDGYRLSFGAMIAGDVFDALQRSNGRRFTTFDVDNDESTPYNCAIWRQSAWWHRNCTTVNPMGPYASVEDCASWICPLWATQQPYVNVTALRKIQMKIRPG